jgi:hypothetical protein
MNTSTINTQTSAAPATAAGSPNRIKLLGRLACGVPGHSPSPHIHHRHAH